VKEWLTAAGITEGPVLRRVGKGSKVLPDRLRPRSVAFIVKAHATRLGLHAQKTKFTLNRFRPWLHQPKAGITAA
jgi:hypothetical protein